MDPFSAGPHGEAAACSLALVWAEDSMAVTAAEVSEAEALEAAVSAAEEVPLVEEARHAGFNKMASWQSTCCFCRKHRSFSRMTAIQTE